MTTAGLLLAALFGTAPTAAERVAEPSTRDDATARPRAEHGGAVVVGVLPDDAPLSPDAVRPVVQGSFAGTDYEPRIVVVDVPGGLVGRIEWAREVAGDDVAAVYWLEPGTAGGHLLYLFEPSTERIYLRELPAGEAGPVLESLGNMLRSQTLGLAEGGPTGMREVDLPTGPEPQPDPPRPVEEPPPPEPEPPPVAVVALGVHYVGGNVGDGLLWDHGAGLRLDVEFRPAAFVRLDAAANIPPRVLDDPTIRFGRVPIAVTAGYRFRRDKDFRPEVDLGLVVEATYWRADSTEMIAGRSGRSARLAIAPGVGFVWTFFEGLGAHLHGRADVWVLNHDLVLQDGMTTVVLRPLRAHAVAATLHGGLHYRF